MRVKFDTILKAGTRVWAEIGYTRMFAAGPVIILAQETKEPPVATVLLKMSGGKITAIDMCAVPSPEDCFCTGEYPC